MIAQVPAETRGGSRLMVLDRQGRSGVGHYSFSDIGKFLKKGDLVVVNDSRVVPAVVHGRKVTGGRVRLLFLGDGGNGLGKGEKSYRGYRCLIYGKRVRRGTKLLLPGGAEVVVLGRGEEEGGDGFGGGYWVSLAGGVGEDRGALFEYLERWGRTPLPPYIKRSGNGAGGEGKVGSDDIEELDRRRYQTVYAGPPGSVAAPTAGLHFDEGAIAELEGQGVEFAKITLHVGLGTFLPIRSSRLEDHVMHGEEYEISCGTAEAVNRARAEGRRVVAVGTTTVRGLESAVNENGEVKAGRDVTSLFITPGYRFRVVDVLLTNFHLPRSTLVVLVSVFCEAPGVSGSEMILRAYREAIEKGYRFYSYGDAMLII
ncbi:MAG: tRNA preQ1(34) S-adenosylmethionine ribosyltransferase-isomerase QueA [Deltaproteobacteria bacterium]|uniref:S-adenosylmethionine:tRNA ribosyltransferase-isomerase n=1 Tax=Candidatus Zymogenus saltonus TaxID=2844893 RepID=A0A9D8KCL3_9DELT|nr:tRNA preQ1(34) S-adenosylmethionine ribosyltransferase-isomerase QueA [Candidatus Zymogenus saltonus]